MPIGGGGIISGIAIAVKNLLPNVRVIGVQAENCAVNEPSLKEGKPVNRRISADHRRRNRRQASGRNHAADHQEFVDEIVEVAEEEIARGIFHCVQNNRLVVEGAGAAGLAALLAKKIKVSPKRHGLHGSCGGNIDANLLARILEQVLVRQGRYIMLKLLVVRPSGNACQACSITLPKPAQTSSKSFTAARCGSRRSDSVGIEMLLEVRDEQHGREVVNISKKPATTSNAKASAIGNNNKYRFCPFQFLLIMAIRIVCVKTILSEGVFIFLIKYLLSGRALSKFFKK